MSTGTDGNVASDGNPASDSGTPVENDSAPIADAGPGDGSFPPSSLFTFCEAGLNDGSSPHYACLDFENGEGREQGWAEALSVPASPALQITKELAASGVHAARMPANIYQLKISPGLAGGTWAIAAKAYLEVNGSRSAVQIRFSSSNIVNLLVTDGNGSTFGTTGNTRVGTVKIPLGTWTDVLVRITASPNPTDGGYLVSPQVVVADASIPVTPFVGAPLNDVLVGFGGVTNDAGIAFDDVTVDVVQ